MIRTSVAVVLAAAFALPAFVLPAVAQQKSEAAKVPPNEVKNKEAKGRLPAYDAKTVDDTQRDHIAKIQADYRDRINALQAQLDALIAKRDAEIRAVLTMHDASQTRAVNEAERQVKLIDLKHKKAIPVERDANGNLKLLPNRLYQRYEPEIKKFVFEVTGDRPEFETPSAWLMPVSDIPGEWAGGDKDVCYFFAGPPQKGWDVWIAIKAKDARGFYSFWQLTDPPHKSTYRHSEKGFDYYGQDDARPEKGFDYFGQDEAR